MREATARGARGPLPGKHIASFARRVKALLLNAESDERYRPTAWQNSVTPRCTLSLKTPTVAAD
eukprot:3255996-Alexandrium_andersonii.AAC.1